MTTRTTPTAEKRRSQVDDHGTRAPDRTAPAWLARLRNDRRAGIAGVALVAVLFGSFLGWIVPRGPITATQALLWMAGCLVVGAVAGFVTGSRWSLAVVPVLTLVAFEVARLGTDGPTVDGIHLDSILGVIAFVVGRVVPGVLLLVPMLLGGLGGIQMASRDARGSVRSLGAMGWSFLGVLALVAGVMAFSVARPASTAPILGPGGEPMPDSVAELTTVEIGGHDQVIMIRGQSVDAPVLLYLAGGPGGTDLGAMRLDTGLEEDFVVATWEQRGAGKSYPALDPVDTLTLDRAVTDTIEVTDYLRERFDEDRIYLVGNSWGSTLGVLAAQRHPDRFHAYVGTGQMVSQRATDVMFWEDTLAWADETGRSELADRLRRNGPPPYEDVALYQYATSYEHDWNDYPEFDPSTEMPAILFVPEYDWMDRINGFRGFLDTAAVMYPQLQGIDFRIDVPSLDVPVYVVAGEHEARGRAVLAQEWFDTVQAPSKQWIEVDGAGHRPHFERPAVFAEVMGQVLADSGE